MLTKEQVKVFLDDTKYALNHIYEALNEYNKIIEEIQTEIEKLEQSKDVLNELFMFRDQWSPNANYHYC